MMPSERMAYLYSFYHTEEKSGCRLKGRHFFMPKNREYSQGECTSDRIEDGIRQN